ncbi:MAG: BRCT domain-containing protein, partial [Roseburia sp.]
GYDFSQLEDFGEIMNKSLHDWWESKDPMVELLPMEMHFIVEEDNSITNDFISGKTFCVTGAFHTMKRSEIEKIITERGGKLSSSVSKKTDFLLTNDAGSGSTKALKAAELGIPVMSEEEFLEKCGE